MTFAVIAAGGIGNRMGSDDLPKQFIEIKGKPILVHTLEKFTYNKNIDKVIIVSSKEWTGYTEELSKKYFGDNATIVIEGGKTRAETIEKAIEYIFNNFNVADDDIIITHDAVRPFVNDRIIEQNIAVAKDCGACGTAIPATDTIFESTDGETIKSMPDRSFMYQQQTPQTFNLKLLKSLCDSLTDEEKNSLTDTCKIFVLKGKEVRFVKGEMFNIKITYPKDIDFAKALLEGEVL